MVPTATTFCAKAPSGRTVASAPAKATASAAIDALEERMKFEKPLTNAVRSP